MRARPIRRGLSGILVLALLAQSVPSFAFQAAARAAASVRGPAAVPVVPIAVSPRAFGLGLAQSGESSWGGSPAVPGLTGVRGRPASLSTALPSLGGPRLAPRTGVAAEAVFRGIAPRAPGPVLLRDSARPAAAGPNRAFPAARSVGPFTQGPMVGPSLGSLNGAAPAAPKKRLSAAVWGHALARGFVRGGAAGLVETGARSGTPRRPLARPSRTGASSTDGKTPVPSAAGTRRSSARTLAGFFLSLAAAELWLEAGAVVLPQVTFGLSGAFFPMALMAAVSVAAFGLGGLIGGPAVDRAGVRRVYLAGLAVRAVSGIALFSLFSAGMLDFSSMTALLGLDYLAAGVNRVAEAALPAALYGPKLTSLSRFGAWEVRTIEAVGILGPLAVGGTVLAFGFGPALALFAGLLTLATAFAAVTVKPGFAGAAGPGSGLREAFSELRGNPLIRRSLIGVALPLAGTLLIYLLLGHAFGTFLTESPEGASAVVAWLGGLFCGGGMLGSLVTAWSNRRLERRLGAEGLRGAARADAELKSFVRATAAWTAAAAFVLPGLLAFALPGTVFGIAPAFLAVVPLGAALAGMGITAESLIKAVAPSRVLGSIIGLARAWALALTAAAFLPLGYLLDAFSVVSAAGAAVPTPAAFLAAGVLALAAAVWTLAASRRLSALAATAAPPAPFTLTDMKTRAAWRGGTPSDEIVRQIHGIGASVDWSRWFKDIDDYLGSPRTNTLLAYDRGGRLAGFLILGQSYQKDVSETIVRLPVPSYVAYVAARRDDPVPGVGKALLLEAARRTAAAGGTELLLHVRKGDAAVGFYETLSRTIPLKSVVEDDDYVHGEIWLLMTFDLAAQSMDILPYPRQSEVAS